jgi:hypothetical protein
VIENFIGLKRKVGIFIGTKNIRCKYWQVHQIVKSNKVVSLPSPHGLLFNSVISGTCLKVNKIKEIKRVAGLDYPAQYKIRLT